MTHAVFGAVVRLYRRLTKGGIDKWERGRARSMAAMAVGVHAVPLANPAEVEHVDWSHGVAVKMRTDEHPVLDPLRPSPLDSFYGLPAYDGEDTPLFRETVRQFTVEPFELESFTAEWSADMFVRGAR